MPAALLSIPVACQNGPTQTLRSTRTKKSVTSLVQCVHEEVLALAEVLLFSLHLAESSKWRPSVTGDGPLNLGRLDLNDSISNPLRSTLALEDNLASSIVPWIVKFFEYASATSPFVHVACHSDPTEFLRSTDTKKSVMTYIQSCGVQ